MNDTILSCGINHRPLCCRKHPDRIAVKKRRVVLRLYAKNTKIHGTHRLRYRCCVWILMFDITCMMPLFVLSQSTHFNYHHLLTLKSLNYTETFGIWITISIKQNLNNFNLHEIETMKNGNFVFLLIFTNVKWPTFLRSFIWFSVHFLKFYSVSTFSFLIFLPY